MPDQVVPMTFKHLASAGTPAAGSNKFYIDSSGQLHTKLPATTVRNFLYDAQLAAGQLFVGNVSGVATAVTPSGVVLFSNGGVTSFHSSAFGTSSSTACVGNDSRLSDARTPVGTALTSARIWVGSSGNVAAAVAMSGDATISDTGAVTIKTDVALAGNPTTTTQSANNNSTRIATTAYVDAGIAAAVTGLLDFKGSTDASGNPNYPSASKGDAYVVSHAGKVGGASGKSVDVGDVYIASADNAGGTEASVGTSWFVLEHNLQGALLTSDLGVTVQAYDALLAAIAALTTANNKSFYFTGTDTVALYDLSSFGRTFSGSADKTAALDSLMPTSMAKGDILVYDGSHCVRLPAAAEDGMALVSDSTTSTGLKWAFVAGTSSPPEGSLTPYHWWKFDENTGSTSEDFGDGGDIDAIDIDGDVWITSDLPTVAGGNVAAVRLGIHDIQLQFGGTILPDVDTGPWTVMGWTRVGFSAGTSDATAAGQASGDSYYPLVPDGTGAHFTEGVSVVVTDANKISAGWDGDTVESTTVLSPDVWYHWAVRWDGTDLELLIDGEQEDTLAASGAPSEVDYYFIKIGTGPAPYMDADDYRVYGAFMSDAQILAIAEGGSPAGGVNAAPVITRPSNFSMTQDTTHTFASAVISIADADAGSELVRLSITCTHGTATLSQTTGLTFTTGDGTDDVTMVFTGTLTNINAALDDMEFDPTAAYTGSASVVLVCNDLGNTGSGGAKEDTETITITVTSSCSGDCILNKCMDDIQGLSYHAQLKGMWLCLPGSTGMTFKDVSGEGNDLSWSTAGPAFASTSRTNGYKQLDFDGSYHANKIVKSSGDIAAHDLDGTDFTLCCWANWAATPSSNWWETAFMGKDDGGTKWIFTLDPAAGGRLLFHTNAGGTSEYGGQGAAAFGSPSLGTWYHCAVTYNAGTGAWKFYKNGSQIGSGSTNSQSIPNVNAVPFTIGYAEGSNTFNGSVDDIRIIKAVLSGADIAAIYNSGNTDYYPISDC